MVFWFGLTKDESAVRMKKILFAVTNDLFTDRRMIRICSTLANAGFTVQLTGRVRKNSLDLQPMNFTQKRLRLLFEKGKLFYIEYNIRLLFHLLFQKCDIISSVDFDTVLACSVAARLKKIPLVFDAHEYFTEVPELSGRPLIKNIWRTVARLSLRAAKKSYTVNLSLAKILAKEYEIPFEVIRNLPFRQKSEEVPVANAMSPFILLYQGVLNAGRGLEEAILAAKSLENFEFWIIGEGDISSQLRRLVRQNGLESKVIFHGNLSPEFLPSLTGKATLGYNLLDGSSMNYYYSLANKAMDYIQAGVPSLQMRFPEYEILNHDYDVFYFAEELSVLQIVEVIQQIRTNPGLYQQRVLNCRRAAIELCWENEKEKLLDIYQGLSIG
jgi:glycosyltransferase involved in cell wall biosynthesis